jgi:hypothetical protein
MYVVRPQSLRKATDLLALAIIIQVTAFRHNVVCKHAAMVQKVLPLCSFVTCTLRCGQMLHTVKPEDLKLAPSLMISETIQMAA